MTALARVKKARNTTDIPTEQLQHCSDIRNDEHQLAAQAACIGVATVDLYLKFSLTGTLGFSSLRKQTTF